jgi:hypothetical protein
VSSVISTFEVQATRRRIGATRLSIAPAKCSEYAALPTQIAVRLACNDVRDT